jgi:prevent-host-death family protein
VKPAQGDVQRQQRWCGGLTGRQLVIYSRPVVTADRQEALMSDEVLEIAASEFKAKCLELMDRLAARKLNRIVVTKRGRPVAVLSPPPTPEEIADGLFGCLKGRIVAPAGFDFTEPVLDEPLDAAEGPRHR